MASFIVYTEYDTIIMIMITFAVCWGRLAVMAMMAPEWSHGCRLLAAECGRERFAGGLLVAECGRERFAGGHAPQPSVREGALGLEGISAYVAMIKCEDLFLSPFASRKAQGTEAVP